jgi:hypothetical protein
LFKDQLSYETFQRLLVDSIDLLSQMIEKLSIAQVQELENFLSA